MINSNIIAYADDIVLLAPSATSLQMLIDIANNEAITLKLKFNQNKTKCMIFRHSGNKSASLKCFRIGEQPLEFVTTFKYLGYIVQNNLCNSGDINSNRSKFYFEFNYLLRKFSFANVNVKLFLFKQYCLQFYGSELWFNNRRALTNLKHFSVGYHKVIKKILGISYHESNHYACQEAHLLTFEHLINKSKIFGVYRLISCPCNFIMKAADFLSISSMLLKEVYEDLNHNYNIDSLTENGRDSILSRILFVQNHETQMRSLY